MSIINNLMPHQQRYLHEYAELVNRCAALKKMLKDYALDQLDYTPSNSLEMSLIQYQSMVSYKAALLIRIYKVLGKDADDYIETALKEYK